MSIPIGKVFHQRAAPLRAAAQTHSPIGVLPHRRPTPSAHCPTGEHPHQHEAPPTLSAIGILPQQRAAASVYSLIGEQLQRRTALSVPSQCACRCTFCALGHNDVQSHRLSALGARPSALGPSRSATPSPTLPRAASSAQAPARHPRAPTYALGPCAPSPNIHVHMPQSVLKLALSPFATSGDASRGASLGATRCHTRWPPRCLSQYSSLALNTAPTLAMEPPCIARARPGSHHDPSAQGSTGARLQMK